eukprot:49537_1
MNEDIEIVDGKKIILIRPPKSISELNELLLFGYFEQYFPNDVIFLTMQFCGNLFLHDYISIKSYSTETRTIAASNTTQYEINTNVKDFDYDQWKSNLFLQTFNSRKLELSFKKYYQNAMLIKFYITCYFIINLFNYLLNEMYIIDKKTNKIIILCLRIHISFMLLLLAYLLWKNTISNNPNIIIIANICITLTELIICCLLPHPTPHIFIFIMCCIHLLSGVGHIIASIICWFISISFTIIIIVRKPLHWNLIIDIIYVYMTAICSSIIGSIIEYNTRIKFLNNTNIKLAKAKKSTVEILSRLLPIELAQSLIEKGKKINFAIAHSPGVSIMFCDVYNFHHMVSTVPPKILLSLLNTLFSVWDEFVLKYKLFKVETVCSDYMIAGGLPFQFPVINENDFSFPVRMTLLANDLMYSCTDISEIFVPVSSEKIDKIDEQSEFVFDYSLLSDDIDSYTFHILQIRIGMHIGFCYGGSVGKRPPRLRLREYTVKTAWHMKQTCEASQIQMTSRFYNELPNVFEQYTIKRENVSVKGLGVLTTYLLNRIDRNTSDSLLQLQPFNDNKVILDDDCFWNTQSKLIKTLSIME